MHCRTCGAKYRLRSGDEGTVRNTCLCERKAHKCAFKKRGKPPCAVVVQAQLDQFDTKTVERYACIDHAIQELLEEEVAESDAPAARETEPVNPDSRAGMEIEAHEWLAPKDVVVAAVKEQAMRVRCLSCRHDHDYATRKVKELGENPQRKHPLDKRGWKVVCPKCGEQPYKILEEA